MLFFLSAVSSAVEHHLDTVGVTGSNPVSRTIFPPFLLDVENFGQFLCFAVLSHLFVAVMDEAHSLIAQRRRKLIELRKRGVDPFANKFDPSETCRQALENYADGRKTRIAGRIVSHRVMGKSQFLHVKDQSGRIQIYAQKQALGEEAFALLQQSDLGDVVGAEGTLFTTKTGESSIRLAAFVLLSKALRPPPEKWHGLEDTETRYRQRYLDLMANDEVKAVFLKRSEIIREIRNFLHNRGYVEVETPMLQAIPGGAAAQPFITYHKALGRSFYLRIAIELYLKRLLVGGIDRVFEIGRNFRNEGLSRRHNPEFTMLEAYQAYGDYETMMELVQSMIRSAAEKTVGSLLIEHKNKAGAVAKTIDLRPEWRRVRYKDLICKTAGDDWFQQTPDQRRSKALSLGLEIHENDPDFEVTNAIFEKYVEPTLIQPTFVTHLAQRVSAARQTVARRSDNGRSVRMLHQWTGNRPRLHRAKRSPPTTATAGTTSCRRASKTRRRLPRCSGTRHASRRRHGNGNRPALHDTFRARKHSRRHSLPANEAQTNLRQQPPAE